MTTLASSAAQRIAIGGQSVILFYAPVGGGFVTNPLSSVDQGITPTGIPLLPPEDLYISLTGPAGLSAGGGTIALPPGETFFVPVTTENVWVNALSSGHAFSAITYVTVSYPPTPYNGAYPPAGPTNKLTTIPSYPYQQYADDDDIQNFVAAYNDQTQSYVDWFNAINLPIYTQLSGYLLDWVGEGLYGLKRPTLFSYKSRRYGPFNTQAFNTRPALNDANTVGASNVAVTTDDVYKRIITWHFFKGDGRNFTIAWLKRRVLRFLYGANGGDIIDLQAGPNPPDTRQISVEVGVNGALAITIVTGHRMLTGGALFNRFALNSRTGRFNSVTTSVINYTVPAMAATFKEAMDSGALEMPAQYSTTVNIGPF